MADLHPSSESVPTILDGTTPGPWTVEGEAVEWSAHQRSPFDDQGASIVGAVDEAIGASPAVVMGGSQDEQGGAVGVLRAPDARLIAAAPAMALLLRAIHDQHSDSVTEPGWCNSCGFSWPCWHRSMTEHVLSASGSRREVPGAD